MLQEAVRIRGQNTGGRALSRKESAPTGGEYYIDIPSIIQTCNIFGLLLSIAKHSMKTALRWIVS